MANGIEKLSLGLVTSYTNAAVEFWSNSIHRIIAIIIIRLISSSSGDEREGAFLFQRVSVLVQRFNAVLLHDSLPTPDCMD